MMLALRLMSSSLASDAFHNLQGKGRMTKVQEIAEFARNKLIPKTECIIILNHFVTSPLEMYADRSESAGALFYHHFAVTIRMFSFVLLSCALISHDYFVLVVIGSTNLERG